MYALQNTRSFDFPLGPVVGKAGDQKVVVVNPQCRYRVEKVMATDTGDPAGTFVTVGQFLVGNRLQRPVNNGASLLVFFGPFTLGNGVTWDVCEPGFVIAITINFLQDATFYGNLFGSALP